MRLAGTSRLTAPSQTWPVGTLSQAGSMPAATLTMESIVLEGKRRMQGDAHSSREWEATSTCDQAR